MTANFTKTPNEIYAAMPEMGEAELRVTLALVRLTYGYHKNDCRATYNELQEATGMERGGVANGVKAVEKRGFFTRSGRSDWNISVYFVGQNSLPGELKQSTNRTETVYDVDYPENETVYQPNQNSLPGELKTVHDVDCLPDTLKKDKENINIEFELIEHFTELTGFIPPHNTTTMYQEDWLMPMESINRVSGQSQQEAMQRINHAIEVCRGNNGNGKRYVIKNPKSLLTAALNWQPEPAYTNGGQNADKSYNV